LLALPGVKRYRSSLRRKPEQEEFVRHFKKYVYMYMTDCPWEVSTTNRYTITTYEAAVTARRRIKQGETIKYLTGTLVPLTAEEDTDLELTQRNFSIVVSSRKKNSSIFLGPARFSNHDCDANGRLVTRGTDGMEVIAMKNIEVGDEITVSYGDDYFGRGNIECLCHTCEKAERNGWTSREAFGIPRSSASTPSRTIQDITTYSLGRKRKYESDTVSVRSSASSKKAKTLISPSKLQHSWTLPADSDVDSEKALQSNARESHPRNFISPEELGISLVQNTVQADQVDSGGDQTSTVLSSCQTSLALLNNKGRSNKELSGGSRKRTRIDKMTARLLGNLPSSKAAPTSEGSTVSSAEEMRSSSQGSAQSSNTSIEADTTVTIKVELAETTKIESDSLAVTKSQPLDPSFESATRATSVASPMTGYSESHFPPAPEAQAISTLTTTKVSKIQPTDGDSAVLPSVEQATTSHLTVLPISDSIRVPGDYVLTRRLLAQPHDRWIFCRNTRCGGYFIQPNGYQTRRECPRCERHSILYGFPWPKTDPDPRKLLERKKNKEVKSAYRRKGKSGKGTWVEGGGDEEERVMDHRTVHRFVYPDEERETTRRGLLMEAEKTRESGGDHVGASCEPSLLGAGFRVGGSESLARETSESETPEDSRRRSGRFVPMRVYADV
jgi:[histone H4]-N-methyl-L-lysine20 N-methyltransferase